MMYCGECDGCGWVEGGPTLQSRCKACKGTGIIDPATYGKTLFLWNTGVADR